MTWMVPTCVEIICLFNMINTNINESYVDGKQALTYCQWVTLPIRLFCLAVSCVRQPATYSWRTLQSLRRAVAGPRCGCGLDKTGRATPTRDCCTQLHACTVSNSWHCNNGQVMTPSFPQAKELLFCFWLAIHAICKTSESKSHNFEVY